MNRGGVELLLAALALALPVSSGAATGLAILTILAGLPRLLRDARPFARAYAALLAAFLLHGLLLGGVRGAAFALRETWFPLLGFSVGALVAAHPEAAERARRIHLFALCLAAGVWFADLAFDVSPHFSPPGRRRYGFLDDRAQAALQFAFGALAAAAHGRVLVFFFLSAAVFSTESRTAILAWLAAALTAALRRRVRFRWIAGAALLGAALVTPLRPDWTDRWRAIASDSSIIHRLLLWKVARAEWLSSPASFLFGNGFGSLYLTPEKTGEPFADFIGKKAGPQHAHNSYLDFLHAVGAVGFLAVFLYYGFWFRRLAAVRSDATAGAPSAAEAALYVLTAAAVGAWGEKVFTTGMEMLPLWFWIGLAEGERATIEPRPLRPPADRGAGQDVTCAGGRRRARSRRTGRSSVARSTPRAPSRPNEAVREGYLPPL